MNGSSRLVWWIMTGAVALVFALAGIWANSLENRIQLLSSIQISQVELRLNQIEMKERLIETDVKISKLDERLNETHRMVLDHINQKIHVHSR